MKEYNIKAICPSCGRLHETKRPYFYSGRQPARFFCTQCRINFRRMEVEGFAFGNPTNNGQTFKRRAYI